MLPTHKGFSNNTNYAMGGMIWFGGFQDEKQNKQPFLMDRFIYCPLFHFIFMSLLVMVSTKRMSQIELIHEI
jgi:hypothetical protein